MSEPTKPIATYLLCAIWIFLVGTAFVGLAAYANRPGRDKPAPENIPEHLITNNNGEQRFALLMFIHPKCPCTRATLSELKRLMACCKDQLSVRLMFFQPADQSADWSETDLWRTALAISGVRVSKDYDGSIAMEMGACSSGHALLYDPAGNLLFQGGITASRSHEGDNRGKSTISHLVRKRNQTGTSIRTMPTFGCSIFSRPDSSADVEGVQ